MSVLRDVCISYEAIQDKGQYRIARVNAAEGTVLNVRPEVFDTLQQAEAHARMLTDKWYTPSKWHTRWN